MVEDAVCPDENNGTAWDRVFVTPDTGSAFEAGQGLLTAFLFDGAVADSVLELCTVWVSC